MHSAAADDIHGGTVLVRDDFTPLPDHVPGAAVGAGGDALAGAGAAPGGGSGAAAVPSSGGGRGGAGPWRADAPAGLELPSDFDSLPQAEREMLMEVLRASHAEAQAQSGPGGSPSGAAGGGIGAAAPAPASAGSAVPPGVHPTAAYAYSGFSGGGGGSSGAAIPGPAPVPAPSGGSVGIGVPATLFAGGASGGGGGGGGGAASDGWFADGRENLPLGVIGTGSGPLDLSRPIGAGSAGYADGASAGGPLGLPPAAPGLRPHVTLTGVPSTSGVGPSGGGGSSSSASLAGSSGPSLHGSVSSGSLAPGTAPGAGHLSHSGSSSGGGFSSASGAAALGGPPRPGNANDRYGAQAARGAALHQARLERERAQLSSDEAMARRMQLEEQGYVFDAAGNVVSRPPGAGGGPGSGSRSASGADSGGSTPSGGSGDRRQAGGGTIKPKGSGGGDCIIM